jgi:SAM-dependent methyltransferase
MSNALRANRGGGTPHLSNAYGQFTYFDTQLGHPDWRGKVVLDFGGNQGNLLEHPGCPIDDRDYWCVDLCEAALGAGRQRRPDAHWVFYDRYNFQFNPGGRVGLPVPELSETFDFILAYSVFTHTSRPDMLDLVAQLLGRLRTGGRLALTFLDPYYDPASRHDGRASDQPDHNISPRDGEILVGNNLRWRLQRRGEFSPHLAVDDLAERCRHVSWCTLANDELFPEQDGPALPPADAGRLLYEVFYTPEYLRSILPGAEVRPPASPSRHHCCIIVKDRQS